MYVYKKGDLGKLTSERRLKDSLRSDECRLLNSKATNNNKRKQIALDGENLT